MTNIIIEITKYMSILLMSIYTFECFSVFRETTPQEKRSILNTQTFLTFVLHFMNYLVLYLKAEDQQMMLILYAAEAVFLILTISIYTGLYPKGSRLVLNNMCMLMTIGFIMLARLTPTGCFKQLLMAAAGVLVSFFVPVFVRRWKELSRFKNIYAIIGVLALAAVLVLASVTGGAKLSFSLGPVSIQPSEFIKILFVFYVASSLKKDTSFKNVVITTCVAALHVLILVASRDLGAGVIFFMTYLIMLYVATQKKLYLLAGLGAGSVAAVIAYKLFSHVRIRVEVWKDPFANWDYGYQIGQSLFAIGTGSWLGMGLTKGLPNKIPVAKSDLIFSAITEEFGILFALLLILVCMSCYIMFLNIALQIHDQFYKLVALGLGTCFIFQVFLNIGGVTKFIPSTGVTLPLISYGGSSLMSTAIMFAIIQGLYMLREDEDEEITRRKILEAERNRFDPPRRRRSRL